MTRASSNNVGALVVVLLVGGFLLLVAAILGALAPGDDYPSENRIVGWVG